MRAPRKPQPRRLFTAVAGVTFEGRQRLIRKHCREGDPVLLKREPSNPHSKYAVGVWVRKRAWIFRGWVKVGYIPEEDAPTISRLGANGWEHQASIESVVGGGWFKSWGLRLDIQLRPPASEG